MALAINDIVQVTVDGTLFAQHIIFTLHYRCTTAPSTGTNADNIGSLILHLWAVDTGLMSVKYLDVMSQAYNMRLVRGQKVAPTREAYVEKLLIDNGEVIDTAMPAANSTWVFVKQTERSGRRGRGPSFMPLPSTVWAFQGNLSTVGSAERLALVNQVPAMVIVPTGGEYEPVIYHKGQSPAYDRITHCTIKQEVRVMSRRTVGRGI